MKKPDRLKPFDKAKDRRDGDFFKGTVSPRGFINLVKEESIVESKKPKK